MFESLHDFLAWQPPKLREIISHGILPTGGKLVLAGREETFKTMLSTFAGFQIALGQPLFGFRTTPIRVGMLQSQLPKAMFQERIQQLVGNHNSPLLKADFHFANISNIKLNKPNGFAMLATAVKNLKLGLVILDPLFKILAGDTNDRAEMTKLLDNLDMISEQYGCAFWIVHHKRKYQLSNGEIVDFGTDELTGSAVLKDWAITVLIISELRDEEGSDILKLDFAKTTYAHTRLLPLRIQFNRSDLSFKLIGVDMSADELKEE